MLKRIHDTIRNHNMLAGCGNIVVGVSGGADSVCLVFALKNIIEAFYPHINLAAAHVNHMIRGENADEDEQYVIKLCQGLDIPVYAVRRNIPEISKAKGISAEMAGREARYEFFNEIVCKFENCKIAVAHNYDDRAETILLNIIRGTGLSGLKGIAYQRDNIIRPLLDVKKSDIREYCAANGLVVREDSSNNEEIYTRNKIRLSLIPYMNNIFNTDISDKLIRLGNNVVPNEDFIRQSAVSALTCCVEMVDGENALDVKAFGDLHLAVKIQILQNLCQSKLESVHMDALIEFIASAMTGKKFEVPGGMVAEKAYGKVFFKTHKKAERVAFEYSLEEGEAVVNEIFTSVKSKIHDFDIKCWDKSRKVENLSFKQLFDYDKMKNVVIRNRREGDMFRPYNGNGSKRLNDFFTDSKVPVSERDKQLVLANGKDIVWVAGMRVGRDYLPDENTKRILEIEVIKF